MKKTKRCKHYWRYEHSVYSDENGKTHFAIRMCVECGQWQRGVIKWRSVKECPVEPNPELERRLGGRS